MPLNNSYDEQAVIQAIASALETFYGTLIEKIDGLNIQKVMKRKCCEIVEKAQKREGAVGYEFPWREVDESQIEVNGF